MAEIQLTREEANIAAAWPDLCVRCGALSSRRVEVPNKNAGNIDLGSLAVPLCEQHLDHWRQYRRRTLLAGLVVMFAMALSAAVYWFVSDVPRRRDLVEAIAGLVVIPGVVGVAIGLPWAICLGYPIHVRDASTNWITLAGVSGKFVKAWKARPPSIESSSEVPCLDVFPYRPDGVCPWPATLFLFLAAVLGGLIAGLAIGGGGLQLATFTQGWDNNDVRYLGVLGILLFFQGVLFWVMLVSWRRLYVVVPILMLPAAVLLVLLAWGVSFLGIIKLSSATTTCLYFLPLILLMLLVYRQTVVQKIRSPLVAGIAGAVGLFLALLGLWLSTQGSDFFRRNRDMAIFYLGASAGSAWICARAAREPFCTHCNTWMLRRALGGLSRPADRCTEILRRGEIVRLASEPVRESADAGDVELAVYECPGCQDKGQCVLHAVAVTKANNKTQRGSLGYWRYPQTAWPILQELFPKLRENRGAQKSFPKEPEEKRDCPGVCDTGPCR